MVVRTFYAEHTNSGGVVSVNFSLNKHKTSYGEWSVEVQLLGYTYTHAFTVLEFCEYERKSIVTLDW